MAPQYVLEHLAKEKKTSSRFPVRIIFTDEFDQYKKLVQYLSQTCDEVFKLSSFCTGEDVFPNFNNLKAELKHHPDKQIVVLGMSEYLRLGIKREQNKERAQFKNLWTLQQNGSSKTRLIFPLFACQDIWERIIPEVDERQLDFIWKCEPLKNDAVRFDLELFPMDFLAVIPEEERIIGFRSWLESWDDYFEQQRNPCKIATNLALYAENSSAIVTTRVISQPFTYIKTKICSGEKLKQEWGTEEQWLSLLPSIQEQMNFNDVIKKKLNFINFDSLSLLGKWHMMSDDEKWLFWLWYKLNSSDDYVNFAVSRARDYKSVVEELIMSIFEAYKQRPEWIVERATVLNVLKIEKLGSQFFKSLDQIKVFETRLDLINCETHEEKTYAIKTIGSWLNKGAEPSAVAETIKNKYFLLHHYLTNNCPGYICEVQEYFDWYRHQKLMNVLPDYTEKRIENVPLETIPSRYSILKKYQQKNLFVLWIDAMGAEWLPLLRSCLEKIPEIIFTEDTIAQAILPTETCYNAQWHEMTLAYKKLDKLDILAHKGMPDDKDYYSCIVNQLEVIADVATQVSELLNDYESIVITADHGTSRLAALAFHKWSGLVAPKNATVCSHGRYCVIDGQASEFGILPFIEKTTIDGKTYNVISNYQHYKQSGNAAGGNTDEAIVGELHGGGTPEEVLVPVVVVTKKKVHEVLAYRLNDDSVYRNNKKEVVIELDFNKPVKTVAVNAEDMEGVIEFITAKQWRVTFKNASLQTYSMKVIADGILLTENKAFTVKSKGLTQNDDPLGGF